MTHTPSRPKKLLVAGAVSAECHVCGAQAILPWAAPNHAGVWRRGLMRSDGGHRANAQHRHP